MKKLLTLLFVLSMALSASAAGWPGKYTGVMLQGFSWDSYSESQWTVLESQAADMKNFIDLVWVPQSGKCLESYQVMGYTPYYYFNQNSSFGSESQLRSMINTFKANGIGTIADVVVNHHNTTGWFGFPAETYNGVTYQLQSTDIVADDDDSATKTQADKEGVSLSNNKDEGEGWGGMRDLDHKSENVQKVVKAYVKFLKEDLGYTGFRYDMVKGFAGSHVADYNDAAGVEYSVGECWDSNSAIQNWIKAADFKSAAFDFQFRYNVRDAINNNDWSRLNSTNNLVSDATYRPYAVTFIENHDTQYRSATETLDPIKKDTLAANAYLLAMPGTPCIFQPHWLAYTNELKSMIEARKMAGINNESSFYNMNKAAQSYANAVMGSNANLVVVVGNNVGAYTPTSVQYVQILSGYHYRYYMQKKAETAWIDKASGTYTSAFDATLTAVSTKNAKLVYTLDGSTPTAKSTQVESGTKVSIASSCTLTVGLLVDGVVSGIVSHDYKVEVFEPQKITVYVNVDKVNWSKVNFYTWGSENSANKSKDWPGDAVTATKEVNGKTWYYKEYTLTSAKDIVNFVFSTGTGSPQTVDVTGVKATSFFEVSSSKEGAKNLVNDVSSTVTAISNAVLSPTRQQDDAWYTTDGIRMKSQPTAKGIYIHQGKKYVVK